MSPEAIIEKALGMEVVLFLKDGGLSYRAPTGTGIPAELREAIVANKAAIVEYLRYLEIQGRATQTLPSIVRRERESDTPLSYGQQQLMLVDRLGGGSRQFNIQGVFRAEGVLDLAALRRAVHRIAQRHEVLRTNIVELGGAFFQFANAEFEVPCRHADLSALPAGEQAQALAALIREDAEAPFDLEQDLMLRMQVVRLSEREHAITFCMHHIASDGWSLGVFVKELKRFYAEAVAGEEIPAQELSIQYADYAGWQRELLEGPFKASALAFWTNYLKDIPEIHALPLDHARQAEPDVAAVRIEQRIDRALLTRIKSTCSARGATLFMLLQTAFSLLLHRFSHEQDIVVGTPMSGRIDAALEPLVGLFINTVVLRNRFDAGRTFAEHLQTNRDNNLSVHEYQYLPFEQLVEALNPPRSSAYNPLFQIWFVLQNNEQVTVELPGCVIRPDDSAQVDTAKYELNVYASEADDGLSIAWVARKALFKPETITYLTQQFERLLGAIVEDPDRKIGEYPLFESAVPAAVLDRATSVVDTTPVLTRFRQQVATRPGAVAIRAEGREVSYRELDALSDRFAAVLAGSDQSRIGLCLNHGVDVVVAIWACIKAGKVYVPLNPEYPLERLRYIVEDAAIGWIVKNSRTDAVVADLQAATLIDIGAAGVEALAPVPAAPSELAYVLYTSGSTGKPKGVMQRHRHVAYYVDCYASALNIGPDDRLLQVASFSHDAAVLDMFAALTTGACLQLMDLKRRSPQEVLLAIDEGVTVYHSSASVFKYLFAEAKGRAFAALRAAVFGGEAPDAATLRLAEVSLPGHCAVINLYGSSEATLVSMQTRRVDEGLDACRYLAGVMPGSRLRIVDASGSAASVYQPGELVVESAALAEGYINLPALTDERFSAAGDGRRAYRTGDLGYLLPDGSIRFLGRRDNQFKLNGQRIEPEEVEAVLVNCPHVRSCVVVPKVDESTGDAFIAAFVTTDDNAPTWTVLAEAIRQRLASVLPPYMVPAVIAPVEALLYTASGKIDRNRMRQWEASRSEKAATVLPRSQLERELSAIWTQVLGAADIGVEDNFFALGGNSFKSLQIITAVARRFDAELSLREFFDAPTIAGCAQLIQTKRGTDAGRREVAVIEADPTQRHEPFPLTGIQQAYWLGRNSAFDLGNVATQGYVEHDIGDYDHSRMVGALRRIIARHDMLRAVIGDSGDQRILEQVPDYAIATFDFSRESGEALARHLDELREEMRSQVRSVHRWPIFDFRVTLLPGGVGRLHVCTDAIIMDARSRAILVRELLELYLDPETALPTLEISFRDYVMAESRLKQTAAWREASQYWLSRIDTLPEAPELPLALDPSQLDKPEFVRRNHRLARETWEKLSACASQLQVTPINLLVTAFADVLAYWGARRDFTLNLTLFNRLPLHQDVERLIGDFTSSSLLEVHVTPHSSFVERAVQTQRQLLNDIDHRLFSGVDVLRQLMGRGKSAGAALMPVVFTGLVGFRQAEERESRAQQLMNNGTTAIGATQTSQVYLDCQVYDDGDSVAITWNCVDALFFPGVLDDMFAAYVGWLERLADDAQARHQRVISLLPAWQRALIDASNATDAPRESRLLHELFVDNVPAFGDSPAVISPDVTLTYRQLDRESTRLAARLSAHGVSANQHVAVLMRKGWQQVVAVIAILKAGGAYLPIDASLPQQRIDVLLEQTQTRVVLVQEGMDVSGLDAALLVEPVVLHPEEALAGDAAKGAVVQKASDLAYTIFTSGSTGVPKGVMIDHTGAVNTIVDINRRFAVGPADRIFAISELNFDLSVYDIFGALAAGAALVIPGANQTRDPQVWRELCQRHSVTIWNSVPALAKLLFDDMASNTTTLPLRVVMMSGDWIPLELPGQIRAALPQGTIYSLGGATEASIWSVGYHVEAIDPEWRSVPYGKPLDNQCMKILNAERQPCPVWVRGDLYIGGIGVALGYYGDARKTEASFIVDEEAGGRLYRTGDLSRWMADGNIEFLGREDSQVKINGYRIELGEIESQLVKLDGVKESVVVTVGEKNERRLVAYVVPDAPGMAAAADWQDAPLAERLGAGLRQSLPAYMVPDIYIALSDIPLTANGKVDRRNLPTRDFAASARAAYVAPETPFEEEIVAVWQQLLQKEAIGVTDNFFALGGNSILAVRVITALREKYQLSGENFQFNDFFSAATVRGVAAIVERLVADAGSRVPAELVDSDEYAESGLV
ncbi:non-ribosomal peptide synthetase [Tahibacter amnicola]|uniref:Amino acid adenylation domain-containing protein n=1 Tax=Tahibacter amnicola TaxID=2976241 RepID=A0ABY6B8W5_9GAMM|nr:non-ribosomal peptide synthetase [Tahibacter amnicola]UXI66227.1 amino acid adenylation domain-containing protein [Tahibacter amnicola]